MQSYLALFNVLLTLFLSIAVFSKKSKGSIWLVIILFNYASHDLLRWGLFTEKLFMLVYPPLIIFPLNSFFGSSLYFYTNRVLFNDKKPKIHWHLIVPCIFFLVHLALIIFVPEKMTITDIKNQIGIHRVYTVTFTTILLVYNLVLLWFTFFRILKYNKSYKKHFSTDMSKNLQWIIIFILCNLGFVILKLIVVVYCSITNYGVPFTIADEIVLMMILFVFIYYLINNPQLLPIVKENNTNDDKKYAKVSLSEKLRKQFALKLTNYMNAEQVYLDENISISQLADVLDIPLHHLSMTINIEYNLNFYHYINKHRVKYAQSILIDPNEKNESILMIAYNSGFQSKTTFNKAFKMFIGMTPSEYRKQYLSQIS